MVMYDTLNRHYLRPYGNDWVRTPNFQRLAERALTFDAAYAGSLPTMPCRRELHTGRYNFLHRGWGQLEPFDDSMPGKLRESGVWSHLTTDGYHYFEDGGATYQNRYTSWEGFRGQEGDFWHADLVSEGNPFDREKSEMRWRDWVNRQFMPTVEDMPQHKTFTAGLEFMRRNAKADGWFLQIETFDPHQPFFTRGKYADLYPHECPGPECDWPKSGEGVLDPEHLEGARCHYAALVTMCDDYLGKVLDAMDELDLWSDTMLIVNTDHGFMLGEHGWSGKMSMPCWDEVARLPLFIWDPRAARRGERCSRLVQTIDLAPTVLEFFGLERPPDMQGRPLAETIASDAPAREGGLFGTHSAHVNVTDGRYVYMRAPASPGGGEAYDYTLTATKMRGFLPLERLHGTKMAEAFSFTKGCPLLRIPKPASATYHRQGNLLYDTEADPQQEKPLSDPELEKRMTDLMVRLMRETEAPEEQYRRLGLQPQPT
jgi:arylsulfatase A-like enzyme